MLVARANILHQPIMSPAAQRDVNGQGVIRRRVTVGMWRACRAWAVRAHRNVIIGNVVGARGRPGAARRRDGGAA